MYFWDTDRLAALLAKEELGQGQKIRYYIACFYLQTASTVLPMYLFGLSYSLDVITLASYVASLVVFHLGALKVYKACAHYQKAGVLDTVIVLSLPGLYTQLSYTPLPLPKGTGTFGSFTVLVQCRLWSGFNST